MATEQLEQKHIAHTQVTPDVIVLYMLSKKYKLNLLSLITLYEIYGKDLFLFFYVLSGNPDSSFISKSVKDIELGSNIELPKESNLKLMFTKAKKVSDALRRNSEFGLTTATLPWYHALKQHYVRKDTGIINFYTLVEKESSENPKKKDK